MGFTFFTHRTRISIGICAGFYKHNWVDVNILGLFLIGINSGVDRRRWKIGPWRGAYWELQ